MKYPKLRELREALRAIFSRPYTMDYPAKPHTAMPGFRGKPVPNDTDCIGCGACAQVCPARAIEVRDETERSVPTRVLIWHYDLCIYCGQCERACTTATGVVLGLEYDLSTFNRSTLQAKIEKELLICEDCGEVIAPRQQVLWAARRIGPLASGNYTMLLAMQQELGLPSADTTTDQPRGRHDLYRILCPHCRRQALVFNQAGKLP